MKCSYFRNYKKKVVNVMKFSKIGKDLLSSHTKSAQMNLSQFYLCVHERMIFALHFNNNKR